MFKNYDRVWFDGEKWVIKGMRKWSFHEYYILTLVQCDGAHYALSTTHQVKPLIRMYGVLA